MVASKAHAPYIMEELVMEVNFHMPLNTKFLLLVLLLTHM